MKIEITYPVRDKKKMQRRDIIDRAKWLFLSAAFICPLVNITAGGAAWSVLALWSLWMIWSFFFAPDLVEYNRISQLIKLIANASILLVMIELIYSPNWMIADIIPIICFGGLIASGILFFTDIDKQRQNMMPMLMLILFSIIYPVLVSIFWQQLNGWALIVMGALAFALLTASFMVLGKDFIREFKKRFHAK